MNMPHLIFVSIKGDPVDSHPPTHICFHQRRSSECTCPTSYLFLLKGIQWIHIPKGDPQLIFVSIKGDPVSAHAPPHICFYQRRSSGCTCPTSYLFLSKEIQWMHTCPNSFVSIKGDPVGTHAPPHISFYKRRSSGCTCPTSY